MRQWDGLISLFTLFSLFSSVPFLLGLIISQNFKSAHHFHPGSLVLLSSSSFASFPISVQTTQNGASWQNLG